MKNVFALIFLVLGLIGAILGRFSTEIAITIMMTSVILVSLPDHD